MSITASEIQMTTTHFGAVSAAQTSQWTKRLHDDIMDMSSFNRFRAESCTMADYTLRRLGKKDYAFLHVSQGNWGGERIVARYKCSYLEARRRFSLLLVTRRLKG